MQTAAAETLLGLGDDLLVTDLHLLPGPLLVCLEFSEFGDVEIDLRLGCFRAGQDVAWHERDPRVLFSKVSDTFVDLTEKECKKENVVIFAFLHFLIFDISAFSMFAF